MCKDCFDTEYAGFSSSLQFESFDKELTLKVSNKQLELIYDEAKNTGEYFIYKCNTCKSIWWLSVPENVWRGYFLKENSARLYLDELKKKESQRKKGCLTILIIILIVIIIKVFS